jgi:hypothetical protein
MGSPAASSSSIVDVRETGRDAIGGDAIWRIGVTSVNQCGLVVTSSRHAVSLAARIGRSPRGSRRQGLTSTDGAATTARASCSVVPATTSDRRTGERHLAPSSP